MYMYYLGRVHWDFSVHLWLYACDDGSEESCDQNCKSTEAICGHLRQCVQWFVRAFFSVICKSEVNACANWNKQICWKWDWKQLPVRLVMLFTLNGWMLSILYQFGTYLYLKPATVISVGERPHGSNCPPLPLPFPSLELSHFCVFWHSAASVRMRSHLTVYINWLELCKWTRHFRGSSESSHSSTFRVVHWDCSVIPRTVLILVNTVIHLTPYTNFLFMDPTQLSITCRTLLQMTNSCLGMRLDCLHLLHTKWRVLSNHLSFLTFCSLSDNQISAEGACTLAEALQVNQTLQRLKWVQPFTSFLLHWNCIVSF